MEPRIEIMPPGRFIGMRLRMSFAGLKTRELWQAFMPGKKEITGIDGPFLYSMEVYPDGFFEPFDPTAGFDKWACVKVSNTAAVPEGMEVLPLEGGIYAVFLYQGPPSRAAQFYGSIYGVWLPGSGYRLDNRPHFAVMGEKYKGEAEDSEEEIWIPVRGRDA
jgi:AraC family transcriptional regulator